MSESSVIAGRKAKSLGHLNEEMICSWMNESFPGNFIVDGKPYTKRDIIDVDTDTGYSLKSVSNNHTQCHLTSSKRWCEYFGIDGKLKGWFMSFFGIPGIDVSDGLSRQHRLTKEQIDSKLNTQALEWFNSKKMEIFNVIVRSGMHDTPVSNIIWHTKLNDSREIVPVNQLQEKINGGEWVMNNTTLHFITEDGQKMFHLQMKGSGKKYTSSYHGLMFHIYKCF